VLQFVENTAVGQRKKTEEIQDSNRWDVDLLDRDSVEVGVRGYSKEGNTRRGSSN
jgi:hypothetical protein